MSSGESLRSPDAVYEPDPRTAMFAGQNPPSLIEHHRDIEAIRLSADVPESVAIQFETARNLYLYSWHVYRFFPVAQRQALSTMELELRLRFPGRLPAEYQDPKKKSPTLAKLLGYAIDKGHIRNESFRWWHQAAEERARLRRSMETLRAMIDQELEYVRIEEDEPVSILAEDRSWDLVQILRRSLPALRNELSHGSTMLTNQVLGTIELIAEILCQVYSPVLSEGYRIPA